MDKLFGFSNQWRYSKNNINRKQAGCFFAFFRVGDMSGAPEFYSAAWLPNFSLSRLDDFVQLSHVTVPVR
jgi:hypothetical protein